MATMLGIFVTSFLFLSSVLAVTVAGRESPADAAARIVTSRFGALRETGISMGISEADMDLITSEMATWTKIMAERCEAGVTLTGAKGLTCYRRCLRPHLADMSGLDQCPTIQRDFPRKVRTMFQRCLKPQSHYCEPRGRDDLLACLVVFVGEFALDRMPSLRSCYRTNREVVHEWYNKIKPGCQECYKNLK